MTSNHKKLLTLIVVLAVLAVAAIAVKQWKSPAADQNKPDNKLTGDGPKAMPPATPPATTVKEYDKAEVPPQLPANMPGEKGAQVLNNSEIADSSTGINRVMRTVTTQKTLEEAYAVYSKYLSENGWTIGEKVDVPTLKVINAAKGTAEMKVVISFDGGSKSNMVSINYSYPAK